MANIVWDIDGVCTDLNTYLLQRAPQYFEKKFGKQIVDRDAVDLKEMFNCSKKEEMCFWIHNLNALDYFLLEKPRDGLKEVMDAIHNNGDRNIICTARPMADQDDIIGMGVRTLVLTWMQINKLPIDEVHFVSYDTREIEKMAVCREVNADVIIEDDVKIIEYVGREFPVICYENEKNKYLSSDKIIVAKDNYEIYSAIQNLKDNGTFSLDYTKKVYSKMNN